jgi:deoxyribonuclease-4
MDKLVFGTSGFPSTAPKKDPIAALQIVKDLGLGCMELEFAHGVRIRDETASELARIARRLGIVLTAHAPYYINLNAKEQDKIDSSINRLLQTARLAGLCGAFSMTFHAAFYMKDDPRSVFQIVKKYLHQITDRLRTEGNYIHLRPELTGRKSQFGTLEELCALSTEINSVYPCLDFSHNQTRSEGLGNSYKEFASIFERYKKALGKGALSEMHIHVAGVQYGSKGEIRHLSLKDSQFNYMDFLKACVDFNIKGVVVCESPELEKDALLLKAAYENLAAQPSKPAVVKKIGNIEIALKEPAKKTAKVKKSKAAAKVTKTKSVAKKKPAAAGATQG